MQLTSAEVWSFGAIAAAAIALALLERRFPYNRGQRLLRPGFFTDLIWYGGIQSAVLGFVIGRILGASDAVHGAARHGFVSAWPVALQIAFFVVSHDLYIYLFHRLQHASPLLWRIHEAHHSVPQVDWLSGVRSHPLEILINQTIEFAPLVVLGAAPAVPVLKGAVSAIWGMYIHSNLDVRSGLFQRLLNGPEMHRWHHATNPEAQGRNFATKLAAWDWLFGTAYLPAAKATNYGLGGLDFPGGYFAQVAWAFRRRRA